MASDLLEILLRAIFCVAAVIVLTRLQGLRSFSKMSSFDFAITVAVGSVIASAVISPGETLLYGIMALASLFAVQLVVTKARVVFPGVQRAIDNPPMLVMENGKVLSENLRRTGMSEGDLYGKLREANAFDLSKVHAVIFEPTGDVSVLHGDENTMVSDAVLQGVQR